MTTDSAVVIEVYIPIKKGSEPRPEKVEEEVEVKPRVGKEKVDARANSGTC